jgi:hypothetical protein
MSTFTKWVWFLWRQGIHVYNENDDLANFSKEQPNLVVPNTLLPKLAGY